MHRLFELRQALPDDSEFLFDTYKLTLREHVEWACSLLLRQTYGHARDAGKPLHLKVIKSNPARRLYERLGFRLIAEDATTLTMCMRPQSPLLEHLAQVKSFGPITWSREDLYD
jgi:hypothetical protein